MRAGEPATPKADISSLAKTLHELLTGKPAGETPGRKVAGPFGELLKKMGALEPEDRPTAAEALAELRGMGLGAACPAGSGARVNPPVAPELALAKPRPTPAVGPSPTNEERSDLITWARRYLAGGQTSAAREKVERLKGLPGVAADATVQALGREITAREAVTRPAQVSAVAAKPAPRPAPPEHAPPARAGAAPVPSPPFAWVEKEAFRIVKPGEKWYPQELSREQQEHAAMMGLPIAIEETKSGIVLVFIPPGEFLMGASANDDQAAADEKPQHLVRLDAFYMGLTPVMQAQWENVTGKNRSHFGRSHDDNTRVRPVENVSWDDAHEFLRKVGKGLRLPSEAEWEYAARGGTSTRYYWGDEYLKARANGHEGGPGETSVVGRYAPNPYGLLDVTGNVYEWCQDRWHYDDVHTLFPADYLAQVTCKAAPSTGKAWEDGGEKTRVVRGGSWVDFPGFLRVSYRCNLSPDSRHYYVGFRCTRGANLP